MAVSIIVGTESDSAGRRRLHRLDDHARWAAGDVTPKTASIPILDDRRFEGPEAFDVVFEDARGAGLGATATARVTITDYEEGTLQFTAGTAELREDGGEVVLEVERTAGTNGEVSVSFSTQSGTAAGSEDYRATTGRLTWADGDARVQQIRVPILDDRLVEGPETLNVVLLSPVGGANVGASQTQVTILDWEEGALRFSQASVPVREDAGEVILQVERTNGADGDVAVDLISSAAPSEPSAQAGQDFLGETVRLAFSEGETGPRTIAIPILDDTEQEGEERFIVSLAAATNGAVVGDVGVATVVITDWEEGALQFAGPTTGVREDAGFAEIEVLRVGGSDGEASVRIGTIADSASEGSDFTPLSDELTWAAGDSMNRTVRVALVDDALTEGPERFLLRLSEAGGGRLGDPAELAVEIEDIEPGRIVFADDRVQVSEDQGEVVLQAQRIEGSSGRATVDFAVVPGTAGVNVDFTDVSGTLTFENEDVGPKEIRVALQDDLLPESPETFEVQFANPTGGVAIGGSAVVTVTDAGAGQVGPTEDAYAVAEATGELTIDIERKGETIGPLVVTYRAESGTAAALTDFVELEGQLEWADGEAGIRSIVVRVLNDEDVEGDESFEVVLESDNPGATLASPISVTLVDDDEGGCGCNAVEQRSAPSPAWAALALILFVLYRRRFE